MVNREDAMKTIDGHCFFPRGARYSLLTGDMTTLPLIVPTLTKAVDMGHTWSKYGNGMGQPMTNVWVLYGFYMGC